MRKISEMEKAVVMRGDSKLRLGKIKHAVFHPTEPRLVGFIVHKHDTAAMIAHPDKFLAYDSFKVADGRLHASLVPDALDERAYKRLGLDCDKCVVWKGMPLVSSDGAELGRVEDVEYDERTGEVHRIITSDGALASFLVGNYNHGCMGYKGYKDGKLIIDSEADTNNATGGVAAAAGEAVGKMKYKLKQKKPEADDKMKNVAKKADDVIQDGAFALGKQLGKTKGMFKAFKEEYDKERHRDD